MKYEFIYATLYVQSGTYKILSHIYELLSRTYDLLSRTQALSQLIKLVSGTSERVCHELLIGI